MEKKENPYREIISGMSLFGSMQILQVLINVARGKFIACLLGPTGMGISALFNSSSLTLQRFASLGLNLAIVKDVAAFSEDKEKLAMTVTVARRLLTVTSLSAAAICVILSRWLSVITFGDTSMQWQFMLLGIAVGLSVAYSGKLSILQGLHEVRKLSRTSVAGGLTGLCAGVPLYYFFGYAGIVPAIIVLTLSLFIFYSVNLRKSTGHMPRQRFRWIEHKGPVKSLLGMGILLMSNDLLLSLCQYLINIFINAKGSTDTVGLYQAASSITLQYSGVVFTVMAMDYFPRLSKAAADNGEMRMVVNRQLIVTSLVIAPATGSLIMTSPILIRLLLAPEFLPVTGLMRWMGLGITIRALMMPLGYISFAKGNKKLFFWMEGIGCNMLTLILSCTSFHLFGLNGLGYALVADNAICLLVYYIINRRLYNFRLNRLTLLMIGITLLLTILIFISSTLSRFPYIAMSLLILISISISMIVFRKLLR